MLRTTQSCGIYEGLGILIAQSPWCYKQLKVVDDMNDSRLWAKGFRCYEQLRVVVYMKESRLWALGFRCYEQLRPVDDMSYSTSWAHGFRCYEQLKPVVDMNDSGSCELKSLGDMNNLGLWMILTILGREPKALNVMNSSRLWITWMS